MSLRRFFATVVTLGACAVASLAAAGTASAEAYVLHASNVQTISGSFYNICELSQGPDSPMFTATGRWQQQVTLVQISELHFAVTMHTTSNLVGSYPDGRNVVAHTTENISEVLNVDPSSLETGDVKLASALVVTSVEHEVINVQGKGGAPDRNYDATVHATFTPDLRVASLVVEYRGGC
jgi:hypothetical protein